MVEIEKIYKIVTVHKIIFYFGMLLCFSETTYAQDIQKDILRNWYADVSNYKEYLAGKIDTISLSAYPDSNKAIGTDKDYISWQHQNRGKFKLIILPGRQWGLSTPLISSTYKWNINKKKRGNCILYIKSKSDKVEKYKLIPQYEDNYIRNITLVKMTE